MITPHPPSGSQPLHREEAHTSWWLSAPREGFTGRAETEQQPRMARSATAKKVGGWTIGWSVPKSRRSL